MNRADYQLSRRAVAGDELACEEIYNKSKVRLFAVCRSMTHCHEDAEDMMQDVYLLAFKNLRFYRGHAKLSTWLYRICVNIYLMKKRKHQPEMVAYNHFQFDDMFGRMPLLVDWFLKEKIEDAVQSLPLKYQEVFSLLYVKELTAVDAAKVLHASETNTKTRGYRARGVLKERLHECH